MVAFPICRDHAAGRYKAVQQYRSCNQADTRYIQYRSRGSHDSNKNSLSTGDPENSGFNNIQLQVSALRQWWMGQSAHILEEVLQPHSPALEELGAELGDDTLRGQRGHGGLRVGEGLQQPITKLVELGEALANPERCALQGGWSAPTYIYTIIRVSRCRRDRQRRSSTLAVSQPDLREGFRR